MHFLSRPRLRRILLQLEILFFTFLGSWYVPQHNFDMRLMNQVVAVVVVGGWLTGMFVQKRTWPRNPFDGSLLAYLVACAIAVIFAVDPRVSLEALWRIILHSLLFYRYLDLMRRYGPRRIIEPVLFASALVIGMGCLEFTAWYFGFPPFPGIPISWLEVGGLARPVPPILYRLSVTFQVSTFLSGYLAFLIPIGLSWMLSTRSRDTRLGLMLWLAGAALVEILTFSRGGLLSLAVSLPAFAILAWIGSSDLRERLKRYLLDWRVGLAIGLALVALISLWLSRDLSGHISGDKDRLELWRSAWKIGLSHPITGVGPGGFNRAMRAVRDPALARGVDGILAPHNVPLLIWAEEGALGVVALLGLVVTAISVAYQRLRGAESGDVLRVAGVCAALLGFAVHNLVDTFTTGSSMMVSVVALAGYLALPFSPTERTRHGSNRVVAGMVSTLLLLVAGGWMVSDVAQNAFNRSIDQARAGDFFPANLSVSKARQIDPSMRLYTFQQAQYLGTLAAGDQSYLNEAILVYQDALQFNDSSDVNEANYGVLLYESGDLEGAVDAMQRAVAIFPVEPRTWIWLGALAEEKGDDTLARSSYHQALELHPAWVSLSYWDRTALRRTVLQNFLQAYAVSDVPVAQLALLPVGCWTYVASPNEGDPFCQGAVTLWIGGQPSTALPLLTQSIEQNPAYSGYYLARGAAYLQVGDLEAARLDARTALFLLDTGAYDLLAEVAGREGNKELAEEFNALAKRPLAVGLAWSAGNYGRRSWLDWLPQLDDLVPGVNER